MGGLQGGARLGVVSTRRDVWALHNTHMLVGRECGARWWDGCAVHLHRRLRGKSAPAELFGALMHAHLGRRARVGRRLARWAVRPHGVEADYSPDATADVSCRARHPTPSRSPARELVGLGRARIHISHVEQSEYGILTRISRPFCCIMFCAGTCDRSRFDLPAPATDG
jgi:hypothetical protein